MPVPTPVVTPAAATRRTTIGALLLGLGVVAGCDLDPSTGDAGSSPQATVDPDVGLVRDVLAEISAVAGLVSSAGAAHPPLGDPMAALGRLHDAQAAALDAGPSAGSATAAQAPTFADPSAALRAVRRREQRLEHMLVDWSVAARSGALARLLASMSAGVAQHLAALPGTVAT